MQIAVSSVEKHHAAALVEIGKFPAGVAFPQRTATATIVPG
jgi:hypothetical protein